MKRLVVLLVLGTITLASSLASASQLGVTPASITPTMVASVVVPIPLSLTNGGTVAGQADTGDVLTISFPRAIDPTSMCSTWSTTGVQSIGGNAGVATIADGTTDSLTVSSPGTCGTGFNLGTIDLGSGAYTSGGSLSFSGNGANSRTNITYDTTTFVLTVTFGTRAGTGVAGTVASTTATFTPSATLRWSDGSSVAPASGTTTGVVL